MEIKPILITVTDGRRSNILRHQFFHYKNNIKAAFIVIYEHEYSNKSIYDEIKTIEKISGLNINIIIKKARFSDIQEVTNIYNEIKNLYPNDWWIIADDDELQIYREPISNLIEECEKSKYEYACGGFIDRIGADGTFPQIKSECNLWEIFPIAAFFRYQLSGGCPNKVCLAKGKLKLGIGQHFIEKNNKIIHSEAYLLDEKRYPIDKNFIQVHHFKWDDTVINRLIASINVDKDYACSSEFKRMFDCIKTNNFKIDIKNPSFFAMYLNKNDYNAYIYWEEVKKIILYRKNQW